jgi:drug/metabolite transporter (DMT)-like permease
MALTDNMRGILYMNVSMLAFTLNDTFVKAVTQTLPLFEVIFLRGILSSLALALIALLTQGGLYLWPAGPDRRILGWRTLGEVGGTVFFLVALTQMSLANLSAIMQFLPIAVTLAAALILREQIGWRRMLAILVGLAGVLMIIRPGAASFDIYSLLGLASVGFVVLRDLTTRRFSRALPSVTPALWAALAVTLMGLGGMLFQGGTLPDLRESLLILGAAVFLIIGYLFAVMVMRVGDIGVVAPFRYMALLWAIVLGWLLFGTLPDAWTVGGAGVVVASGIYILLRERRLRLAKIAGLGPNLDTGPAKP